MSGLCARLVAVTLAASLFAACNSVHPLPPGAGNEGLRTGDLRTKNPLDIAVLPVQNSTEVELPIDRIRRAFWAGLVRQRYSPLALAYVDAQIDPKAVEAGYTPGKLQESGILQLFITGWNESKWKSHAELSIQGEIYLLDVANPDPAHALWGGNFDRRVSVLTERPSFSTDTDLMSRAIDRFAEEILGALPPRNPEKLDPR